MKLTQKYVDELTYKVIGCAIEVHKHIGPGLLEGVYEKCFMRELSLQSIAYKNQMSVPLEYKGLFLDAYLRFDVMVEDVLLVELKATESLLSVHEATLLTYMRLLKKPKGILINFNCTNIFRYGQKTLVNDVYACLPDQ